MTQKTWTIGSAPSCDIVVASPIVSARHCRLTAAGGKLTLTDLGSTNGTMVNGRPLSGSIDVSLSDRVTLGQTEALPWPESLCGAKIAELPHHSDSVQRGDGNDSRPRRITIGRVADNTVVLNHSNISSHHARLIINGDHIVLEDLGSTNGTSVGTVENKISRTQVVTTDTVFFGSTSHQVDQLIDLANQPDSVSSLPEPTTTPASSVIPRREKFNVQWQVFAAISVALLFCTVMTSVAWWMTIDDGNQIADGVATDRAGDAPMEIQRDGNQTDHAPEVTVPTTEDLAIVESRVDTAPPADSIAGSLFVIVCSDLEGKTPFRVGTGFAIGPNRIVTSASVIDAMKELNANGFPKSFLYSPLTDQWRSVQSTKTHPQYARWNETARAARQSHDELFDQLESTRPKPEAFETVKTRLIDARMKAINAMDRKTSYDVGLLSIDRPTDRWLSLATSSTSLRPNQKLTVAGYAFDLQDPFFDPEFPFEVSNMQCRVGRRLSDPEGSADRLLVNATVEQTDDIFLGSPAVNAKGEVVAVYSRPAPPADVGSESGPPMFDAALFQRINECEL
ncbi:FHA domain-containing protein [Stieleria sp. ICT_E10.1]|uniref:FHA domain-containing protein n=1 Tax=Stieleria sedimenti TaxID=2976331 RepID=UPI002180513B|nr:FHA domain-containing protein [Stieleria sedimenti]MCS7470525.1 FHA domain-containing protein [Stieleria sedimenti]